MHAQTLVGQLTAQTGAPHLRVIVVDDASPQPYPPSDRVQLIRRATNGGFGAAVNTGMAAVETQYALVLNSDITIEPTFVTELLAAASPFQPAVVSPSIVNGDGEFQWPGRKFPRTFHYFVEWLTILARFKDTRWRHAAIGHDVRALPGMTTPVEWVVGAAMLIPVAEFRAVGGFDERFHMNCEEVDVQRRLRFRGVSSVLAGSVTAVHAGGASSGTAQSRVQRLLDARFQYAGKWGQQPGVLRLSILVASVLNAVHDKVRAASRAPSSHSSEMVFALIRESEWVRRAIELPLGRRMYRLAKGAAARLRLTPNSRLHGQQVREYRRCRAMPIDRKTVLYQGTIMAGFTGNLRAIVEASLVALPDYRHVWVRWSPDEQLDLPDDPRVSDVPFNSAEYFRSLGTAEYLVNDSAFPSYLDPRDDQIYVYTSHGIPLKKMGADMEGAAAAPLRDIAIADILISAGSYMTRTLYGGPPDITGRTGQRVLEIGLPRVDTQLRGSADRVREELRTRGLLNRDQAVVLYAPTWRPDVNFRASTAAAAAQLDTSRAMHDALLDSEYQVLTKLHPGLLDQVTNEGGRPVLTVPRTVDTNELLAATDVLVTDYSSIFFDFLSLDRPIIFYLPDIESYRRKRGVYLSLDSLPGIIAQDLDELVSALGTVISGQDEYAALRQRWRDEYTPHDDGRASARFVAEVFRRD